MNTHNHVEKFTEKINPMKKSSQNPLKNPAKTPHFQVHTTP